MRFFTKGSLLFILVVFASFMTFAGTIKGTVNDKQSGEPLLGAIVDLKGTAYGATSGLDGSYKLENVPAGTYDFEIKFSSYETYTQHITITDNQTLVINEDLKSATHALDEVEITGKYKNGSDEQSRNIEKNSEVTMNIMSARSIELLPDITVANVLQRVSGVQVMRDNNGEARYAAIRGMPPRYTYTTVDGIKIASPDDKARFVPLDIFPAEILDRVEVIKTLTPDMEGDAIGGVTNLVMKKAPDHAVVYASAATGYNENSLDEHFNSFDKSDIVKNDPTTLYGLNYSAKLSDFFPLGSSVIKPEQAPVNSLYSVSLGNRFFKHKLGVMVTGSYQNTFKETNNIFFKPASQPDAGNIPEFDDLELRKYSTQETRIGLHANIDYHLNDKNTFTLGALFVNLNQLEERQIIDTVITAVNRPGPGLGTVDYKNRTAERTDNIQNLDLRGNHLVLKNLKVDWIGAVSKATRDVPDMTEFTYENNFSANPAGGIKQEGQIVKSMSKSWEKTTDQDIQGFLNITYTPSIFGKEIEFKAGAMDRDKNRTNYYNEYDFQPANSIVPYSDIQSLTPASFSFNSAPTGISNANGLDYKTEENIFAYYGQFKFHLLNEKLEVIGGLRVENTYLHDSANLDPHFVLGVTATYNYTDPLPSLNLKYKLNAKANLRLAYYSSISRPGFFEPVPYSFSGEDFNEVGNPYLKRSIAQNLDARYEWIPKGVDQVLIGAFYKNITDPIEYLLARPNGPSAVDIEPENVPGSPAVNYGAEIQVTKYFHYFGVTANYTYTHSAITTQEIYLTPTANGEVNTAVNVTRPLQGQASSVGNIALVYKNPKLGLDAQLGDQYTGRHISLLSGYVGLDYWQKAISLSSFSIEKRLYKYLSIYAKANNLLNSPALVELNYSNSKFTNTSTPAFYLPYQNLKDGKALVESSYYGRNYLIGIKYKLD